MQYAVIIHIFGLAATNTVSPQKAVCYYCFASGTLTYLICLLPHSDENLDELTGKYYAPSQFVDNKADVEKPLTMIYQINYLTIKDYDRDAGTFFLYLPHNEVQKGFISLIAADYFHDRRHDFGGMAHGLYIALRNGEPDLMRELLTSFLAYIIHHAPHGSLHRYRLLLGDRHHRGVEDSF